MKKYAACLLIVLLAFSVSSIAQEDIFFTVEQMVDGKKTTESIDFFQGDTSASQFYDYYDLSSNTGLDRSDSSLLIPYKSPDGSTSLLLIHDKKDDGSPGRVDMRMRGLPSAIDIAVRNDTNETDPVDQYNVSPPEASFSWDWPAEFNDGVVLTGLGEKFSVTVYPDFISGIEDWLVVTGTSESPRTIPLDPQNPVTLKRSSVKPPTAEFDFPESPVVGQSVLFDASESHDPDGEIVQYQWDFNGDGNYSVVTDEPKIRHKFSEASEYRVGLKVVDSQGAEGTVFKTVQARQVSASVRRELSATNAISGKRIKVTLTLKTETDLNGVGVVEEIPHDWSIVPDRTGGAKFKSSASGTYEWLFTEELLAGEERRIVYYLEVPKWENLSFKALPSEIDLSGTIQATKPRYKAEVVGESRIKVFEALPLYSAVAHYDTDLGELDLTLDQKINMAQLKWAAGLWVNDGNVPGTGGELIGYEELKVLALYKIKGRPVNESITPTDTPEGDFYRIIQTRLPGNKVLMSYKPEEEESFAADNFVVKIVIRPVGRDLQGVGIKEVVPVGWEVRAVQTGKAVYKKSAGKWVFLNPIKQGEEAILSYKVKVPQETRKGIRKILGRMSEAWSNSSFNFAGDSKVEVVRFLDLLTVISRWDIEKGDINLNLGNSITYNQIKKALYFWLEDVEVPYTGEKRVDFDDIKEIVTRWQLGKPVDEPLK